MRGNNMHVKYLAGIVGAALLMAVVAPATNLTAAGQNVRFVEDKPRGMPAYWYGNR